MKTETWYVMEDGSCGDPREISEGAGGILRHKDGRAVSYRPDGVTPRSRGVNVDEERAKAIHGGKKSVNQARADAGFGPVEAKDMKPEESKRSYKTRESKSD